MTGPEEPAGWELMRGIKELKETLARMEGRMLSVEVFKVYSDGNDRRHTEHEKALNAWIGESKAEHAELEAQIKAGEEKRLQLEEKQRESRQRTWLALGIAVLTSLLGVASSLIARGGA